MKIKTWRLSSVALVDLILPDRRKMSLWRRIPVIRLSRDLIDVTHVHNPWNPSSFVCKPLFLKSLTVSVRHIIFFTDD
jgi:hypothetical protein